MKKAEIFADLSTAHAITTALVTWPVPQPISQNV